MELCLTTMDAQAFGARLRSCRKSRRLSQAAVAKAGGISRPAISQWENGETEKVDAEALCKIADFLDTTADYLLFGKPTAKIVEDLAENWYRLTPSQRGAICDQVRDQAAENKSIYDTMRQQPSL